MKRRSRLSGWWIFLLLVVAAGIGWALVTRPWEPKPTLVAIETVTAGPASRVLAVNGRVEPEKKVEISSTVNGRVATVPVIEGDEVAAGEPLLTVDDTQQRATVSQANSQLDAAQSQIQQAQLNLDRAVALGDSISQKQVDDLRFAVETAQKEADRLAALVQQTQDLLDEYVVRAPFSGSVLSRGADPGQVVSSSTSLFLFADLSSLLGEASVDELYASEVRRGLPVKARPAGHAQIIDGEVSYISPRVDSSTGGRLVRVTLPGGGDLDLPVGLTVTLNIIVEQRDDAVTIPRSALADIEEPAVYVIEAGKAVLKPVQYIDWPSDRLIVLQGLANGETLIVDGKAVKAEGALVAARE
ncbi:MAG: efflux RND transporter periplasmic adaptor subunit [Hyphomicrobiales bacterium]|nr:MAG: efflux RND transporter periplasmic adaptor subunit [Hyphomicrobiales bacterium]